MRAPLIVVLALGCSAQPHAPPVDTTPGEVDAPDAGCGDAELPVAFETADGVRLAADWWPAEHEDAPVLVLFHMVPPANDRTNYPRRVRAALHDEGWAVLNVDRRGAGDSEGLAAEATAAPQARQDLEAAVRWLLADGRACAVARDRLVFVGASNGTTALFDYGIDHDPSLPAPAAMVFLSPGTYTIQNHGSTKADLGSAWRLPSPVLWLYPTTEPFSRDFASEAPPGWEFIERGTAHGTRMFDGGPLEDQTLSDTRRYVGAALSAAP